jgi:hypothetical protein
VASTRRLRQAQMALYSDEPDPDYERQRQPDFDAEIREAQKRAYLANQEANDEVIAKWLKRKERSE